MAKRIAFKYTVRHMITGADYSGLIFCRDEAHAITRALLRVRLAIKMRGYKGEPTTRVVEMRKATMIETEQYRERMAQI